MRNAKRYVGGIALGLLAYCSCTPSVHETAHPVVMLLPATVNAFSVSDEQVMGQEQVTMMRNDGVVFISNLEIDQYLKQLVTRLTSCLPIEYPHFAIHVWVVRKTPVASMPELMSYAGGNLIVPLSKLSDVPSEDVLATGIAHEIGHIELHHSARWETARSSLREYLISTYGESAESDPSLKGLFIDLMTYLRVIDVGFEDDADLFAVRLAYRSGYDARAYGAWLREHYSFPAGQTVENGHRSGDERAMAIQAEWERISMLQKPSCTRERRVGSFKRIQGIAKRLLSK